MSGSSIYKHDFFRSTQFTIHVLAVLFRVQDTIRMATKRKGIPERHSTSNYIRYWFWHTYFRWQNFAPWKWQWKGRGRGTIHCGPI